MENQHIEHDHKQAEYLTQKKPSNTVMKSNTHSNFHSWKRYAAIGSILLLLALGGYGYYQFIQLQQWYSDAQFAIENQQQANYAISDYVLLRMQIEEKEKYCQEFLASEAGEFGEFEFCKRYIEWSKELQFEQNNR